MFIRKRPDLPRKESDNDFNGRRFCETIGRALCPLSNNESTASCNIRFSLRTMISGACISINLFKRLLRIITRRYKSFKSDAATWPASKFTNGRISGGITGIISGNIHCGSVLESKNDSTNFNCLIIDLRFASDFVSANSARKRVLSSPISKLEIMERTPSAPIPTWKESSPNSSTAAWYSSSLMTSYCFKLVRPGSVTIYAS